MKGSSIDDLKRGHKLVQEADSILKRSMGTDEELAATLAGCAAVIMVARPLYANMQLHLSKKDFTHEYVEVAKVFMNSYGSYVKTLAAAVAKLKEN
jgi:hypothetical protein